MDYKEKIRVPGNWPAWVEAMRLRTLPVSTAGVLCAWALAVHVARLRWLPALICLGFAVLCQIASNFANEYFDYRDGIDKPGRVGPRRGVTEGDIKPSEMKLAALITLGAALMLGLWLIYWSGPWLLIIGVMIALGALAYSAGPYPLSRNGLGELAAFFFFGIIPVNFTFYLVTGTWSWRALPLSCAIGLMSANVLLVNNYRDADEDRYVGKRTLATILGRPMARQIYFLSGLAAGVLALLGSIGAGGMWIAAVVYLVAHVLVTMGFNLRPGQNPSTLNPYLGITAGLMLFFSLLMFV